MLTTIGVHPALKSRPYMLQRLQRDYHLTTISGGKHLHLAAEGVIATVKLPARKPITYRTNWNGGGDAA